MDAAHVGAWGIFLVIILAMLALDLFVLHRNPHEIRFREALIGAAVPVALALLFSGAVYAVYEHHPFGLGYEPQGIPAKEATFWPDTGSEAMLMYLTGYIIELSLSADNVFLFVILMNYFAVPTRYQHRVLFWGVVGALVMRAVMILAGAALLARFSWIILIFGVFLVFTGIKMLVGGGEEEDPGHSLAVRWARKFLRVTPDFHGQSFFVRVDGKRFVTPLFLVLVTIEITDLVFAVDSIPAVFAITRDPFIVFTSNVFAILGLRSMYFLLAGVMDKFHYLKYGLAIVLTFVGIKMLLPWLGDWAGPYLTGHEAHWHVPTPVSLGVIVVVLLTSVGVSLLFPHKTPGTEDPLHREEPTHAERELERGD